MAHIDTTAARVFYLLQYNQQPVTRRSRRDHFMAQMKFKGKVLIVDDNDMTRTLLRGLLVAEGYQFVGEANNGEQGLEMALRIRPDLVCLDVNMPRSDGLTVLKQLREQAPEVAVVMVTGSTERETVQSAITGGAAGYIVKPFNSAKVLATLEGALKKFAGIPKPAPVASAQTSPAKDAPAGD
jgi:two-component system chemotaxis response regulator CheY